MKKLLLFFVFIGYSISSQAGEWVTLESKDLSDIEVIQANALSFANEGVYIKRNAAFLTTLNCAKKEFVAITDAKLADRVLSAAMFAMASNKTMRFYVEGCNNDYLQGKMFMLIP